MKAIKQLLLSILLLQMVGAQECELCEEGTWCYGGILHQCPPFSRSSEGSGDLSSCMCLNGYVADGLGNCTECSVAEYCYAGIAKSCPPNSRAFRGAWLLEQCMCEEGFTGANTACGQCEAGKYKFWRGEEACLDCDANTFQAGLGATSEDACQSCGGNSTSERGSASATACKCNAGFVSLTGSAPCTACGIGKYSMGIGNTECTSCFAGESSTSRRLLSIWDEISEPGSPIPQSTNVYYFASQSEEECFVCPPTRALTAQSIADNIPLCECEEGYFENSNGVCHRCEAGTYKDWIGPGQCLKCPRDTYSNLEGNWRRSACVDCPENTSAEEGSALVSHCVCQNGFEGIAGEPCTACQDGMVFSGEYDLKGEAVCKPCGAGTYSNGSVVCAMCPPYMTSEQGATSKSDCVCEAGSAGVPCAPCAAGSAKSSAGPGVCEPCAAGTYSESVGARECTRCHDGSSHMLSGAASVFACSCAGGSRMLPDTLFSNFTCEVCELGSVGGGYDRICQVCEAGTYAAATRCLPCPAGSLSARAASDVTGCWCEEGFAGSGGACVACPAGSPQTRWAASTACLPCGPGSFSESAVDECVPCARDSYQVNPGSTSCVKCGEHGVTRLQGAVSALACECTPGHSPQGDDCVPCALGTYKESTGNVSCSICAGDLTTAARGATSAASCAPCANNTYLDFDKACVACPVSSKTVGCKCRPGYYGSFLDCQPCFPGTFSSIFGAANCLSCPSGTVNALWAQRGIESCVLCAAGSYQISAALCIACPAGSSSQEGSISVADCHCAAGSESVLIDGVLGFCRECPAGYFDSGLRVCEACAQGKYGLQAGAVGAASCVDCPSNTMQPTWSRRDSSASCLCVPGYVRQAQGCVACPEGTFSTGVGEVACARCSASSFFQGSGIGNSENLCAPCPANSLAADGGVGIAACQCLRGFYRDSPGVCRECTGGFYCENQEMELPCPDNALSESGSSHISDCVCRRGFYRENNVCKRCKAGEFCRDEVRYACPGNSHTAGAGGAGSLAHCFCEAGYERLDITMAMYSEGFQLCRACPANTYCFGGQIRACPENSVSVVRSATLSDCLCKEGFQGTNGMCIACDSAVSCAGIDVVTSWRIVEVARTVRELGVLKPVRFPNLANICKNLQQQLDIAENIQTMSALNVHVEYEVGDKQFSTTFERVWADMQTLVTQHIGPGTRLTWTVEFEMIVGHASFSEADTLSYVASAMRYAYGVYDTSFWTLTSASGHRRLLDMGFSGTLQVSSLNMPMQTISFDPNAIGSFLRKYGYTVFSGLVGAWVNASQTTSTSQHVSQGSMVAFQTGVELKLLEYTGYQSYENLWVSVNDAWISQEAPLLSDAEAVNLEAETHTNLQFVLHSSSLNAYSVLPTLRIADQVDDDSTAVVSRRRLLAAMEFYSLIHEESVATQAEVRTCDENSTLLGNLCVCNEGFQCPFQYRGVLGCESGRCVSCDDPATYCFDNNQYPCPPYSAVPAHLVPGARKEQCVCEAGRFLNGQVCDECLSGFFCAENTANSCNPDDTDFISVGLARDVSDCRCKAGWFRVAFDASCQPCPLHHFCPETQAVEVFPYVFRCPDNSFTVGSGSSSISDCMCVTGFKLRLEGSVATCMVCDAGELCHSMTDNEVPCPLHTVANLKQDACVCAPGLERGPAGTCVACAPGTIRQDIEQLRCEACPAGKKQVLNECVECETGEVSGQLIGFEGPTHCKCAMPTTYNYASTPRCRPCVYGEVFEARQDRDYDQGVCRACEAGKFYSGGVCLECPHGSSSTAGSTSVSDCFCVCESDCFGSSFCGVLAFGQQGACLGSCGARIVCSACDVGKFKTIAGGSTQCQFCAKGKYADAPGTGLCSGCGFAETTNFAGATSSSDCLCIKGYGFSPESSTCEVCQAGHYKGDVSDSECVQCPQGKYWEGLVASACDSCVETRSTRQSGSTSENDCLCDKGYQQENGICRQCLGRTFKNWVGNQECHSCGITYDDVRDYSGTKVNLTRGAHEFRCVPCEFDYQGNAFNTTYPLCACKPGYQYILGEAQCEVCSAYQVQPLYSYSTSTWTPRCEFCQAEHFFTHPTLTCTRCSINHITESGHEFVNGLVFVDGSQQTWGRSQADCRCLLGYEKDSVSANCMQCTPGKYQISRSDVSCLLCEPGTYAAESGRVGSCDPCPLNSDTRSAGSSDVADCICNVGYVKFGDECAACPVGTFYGASATCEVCASGYFQNETGKTQCVSCGLNTESLNPRDDESTCRCVAGHSRTSEMVPLECQACERGKYSLLEAGVRTCQPCPARSTTENLGAEDDSQCVCDLGATLVAEACVLCERGFYKDTIGNGFCTSCGEDKITSSSGSTSADDCQCDAQLGFY